ncbi:MAG: hypothetical protein GWP09_02530 [Nitrospiraceae bacterium]|nr:hypothetical protein [Nitrospiraceae bacterium]
MVKQEKKKRATLVIFTLTYPVYLIKKVFEYPLSVLKVIKAAKRPKPKVIIPNPTKKGFPLVKYNDNKIIIPK